MTKSTRSNRPELQGLLEAPTRPRGRKSASEQGGGVQYVNSPREISGDPNQRRSPSDPSQPIVSSELVRVETGGGLGDGSRHPIPESSTATLKPPTITHGELAKMSKADQIRILVKEHVAHSKECQKEALLGATPHLRSLLTGAQASQKALQKLINNEEIERYVKGWNPWEEKKTFFPSAAPKKDISRLRFRTNERARSSMSLNLMGNPHSCPNKWRKTTQLLQVAAALFLIPFDENVNKILNKLHQPPLPLAYAMTNKHSEIIVSVSQDMKALKENEEENRTNSQEIVREIKELKLSLINNSDNIISSLREDAIIEKQQQNSFLEEFKKIMINQNKNMSNNFNAQISALNNKVTALNNKIEQISNSSPPKEEPLPNPWSQRVEQSPRITAHNSQVRERPPHLQSSTSRYNNPFMQDNQIKAATQPALITTPTVMNSPADNPQSALQPSVYSDVAAINKAMSPIKDWLKFSAKGEYDHINFMKYIDHMLRVYEAPDHMILPRLPWLFEGAAAEWFALKSEAVRKQPWSIWRQLIKARFSTRIWKTAKHLALDNDYFDPTQHSVYECCLIQKKRVDCVLDNLTLEETNDRLLT
ncbi:hypothetical protein PSTG_01228 [Puccinia striiformis f. sp. tritici PST-78]|uniref:Uncharacterized protein n=1 Tax=Puccinia striiformis f. sp. tritici PST-78 TaxID=1165861 RepID=A0A0L0W2U7_9BASI|nr:hypothetical protein PSTG_01228 [Puccinia striiformis f. sp. tritici PST-78]